MFVSWMDHARARELADALGADLYVPGRRLARAPWPLRYAVQGVLTFLVIMRRRPARILWTNPPFVAGLPILAAARVTGASVWCDAHSGAFNDERWSRFAGANRFVLHRCAGTVLASARLGRELESIDRLRTLIVASPPLQVRDRAPESRPLIVATLGWAWDEPVGALLEAAASAPDIELVLTGHAPLTVRRVAPANCTFSGWLARDEYRSLLARATAVICLTTRDSTMQTGAYEAAEHGIPMILSGTRALREYFDTGGVVFVEDHAPDTLAEAMHTIVGARAEYEQEASAARGTLVERSRRACDELKRAMAEVGVG
jgi:glycosyltransferase involved in cell wall biosynthesis